MRPRRLPWIPGSASTSGWNEGLANTAWSASERSPGAAPVLDENAGSTRTPSAMGCVSAPSTSTRVSFMPAGRSTRSEIHGRSGRPGVYSRVPPRASTEATPFVIDTLTRAGSMRTWRWSVSANAF